MATAESVSIPPPDSRGNNAIPSSSPAFGTPTRPVNQRGPESRPQASILPILLPPATLRPIAFRIFTKKHNLNLTSSALEILSAFVGRHCGSGWREESLAERLLDETAKQWKKNGGAILVSGEDGDLSRILNLVHAPNDASVSDLPRRTTKRISSGSYHATSLHAENVTNAQTLESIESVNQDAAADNGSFTDPRHWLKVVDAHSQPRLSYNPTRRHFESATSPSSLLPTALQRTEVFRQRYHLVHQRLLRNDSFQVSAVQSLKYRSSKKSSMMAGVASQAYSITQIANLLGRGGTMHVLLGMLARSPSGYLTITDPSGSIVIDLQYAQSPSAAAVWYTPGMMVVVEGHYEDGESKAGGSLDGITGVGGTIGGVFVAFAITGPPSEPRDATLGTSKKSDLHNPTVTNFGWVDFLGTGSVRAVGNAMRDIEAKVLSSHEQGSTGEGRHRIVLLGETNIDVPDTITALRRVLALYASESAEDTPMAFVLMGNFFRHAGMVGQGNEGSIAYKEHFDSLALALSDYPTIMQNTTFIFVPGDNDPWGSAISAGTSSLLPHDAIPEVFTSRVRRVFVNANNESERVTEKKSTGEAIWSTNPTRLTIFGPSIEIVLFRDDMLGRLRRYAIDCASTKKTMESTTRRQSDPVHLSETQESSTSPVVTEAFDESTGVAVESMLDAGQSPETLTARKLVKTIIDQGYLSPFPPSKRPVRSDQASSLHLYPLPTAMVLMDAEAPPFALGLDGCHVMNPGPLTASHRKHTAQWLEYNIKSRRGRLKQLRV